MKENKPLIIVQYEKGISEERMIKGTQEIINAIERGNSVCVNTYVKQIVLYSNGDLISLLPPI